MRRHIPWTPLVCALLLAGPAGAADWIGVRSPHFVVLSDADEKAARRVAHQFEQMRSLFESVIHLRVDPKPRPRSPPISIAASSR